MPLVAKQGAQVPLGTKNVVFVCLSKRGATEALAA